MATGAFHHFNWGSIFPASIHDPVNGVQIANIGVPILGADSQLGALVQGGNNTAAVHLDKSFSGALLVRDGSLNKLLGAITSIHPIPVAQLVLNIHFVFSLLFIYHYTKQVVCQDIMLEIIDVFKDKILCFDKLSLQKSLSLWISENYS
jgi:hypothetical protein